MKKTALFFFSIALFVSCSSAKKRVEKSSQKLLGSEFYNNQFTGFLVVDSQNNTPVVKYNSEKYFTPASNTKIFTLFTALQLLPDSIPALKYISKNKTLYIEGTGDPTFLNSNFDSKKTIDFLKKYKKIVLCFNNFEEEKYGAGWAWDDYHYSYQPEIGSFPMYGNIATIDKSRDQTIPSYFKDSVITLENKVHRDLEQNQFYFSPTRKNSLEVPFKTSTDLSKILLSKALNKKVSLAKKMPKGTKKTLYSVHTDSVLKRMMHESDNFIAEQMLLLSSSTLSNKLSAAKTRDYILKEKLSDLRQIPRWVDGSGLSRYNLFTPESMVRILSKMHADLPQDKLLNYFPAGGVSGSTLEDWYAGSPNPYIYAKSGSLSNIYCLSGYLLTKSGKTLIFSFMNNHFKKPSSEVKKQMQGIFEEIRDTY